MKLKRIGQFSALAFLIGCSGSPSPDAAREPAANEAPDGSLAQAVDAVDGGSPLDESSDAAFDVTYEAAPVLGTGTVLANGSTWTMGSGIVEYFTTDAGTFAYYPDASNALCPIPTTYLCVNYAFALCLNDVYTLTVDPCNFNPDGSIQVWVPPDQH